MRRSLAALAAALACWLALAVHNGVAANQPAPIRSLKAEPDAWPAGTWAGYREKYIMPEGRVVDDGNNGISHSEGQGYGMLLAVIADDQATFNRLWTWTRRELYVRPDGLAAWKWEPDKTPRVTDPNNASDGDLLIAWALAEAAERWGKRELATEAEKIARAIDRVNGARSPFGRVLMPGAVGFSATDRPDGPVVNPSYWVFPAFDSLRRIAPQIDWPGYRASGLTLLRHARFGQHKLPPDWLSIAGSKAAVAEGFPPTFSYNAVRIPLYLAWGGVSAPEMHAPYLSLLKASAGNLTEADLKKDAPGEPMGDAGYLAIFALSECVVNQSQIPHGLRSVSFDRYYSATLHMLALVAVRLRYGGCW
ncbi:MAG TPA: glycosyl hydrolase family 8 [Beijerinckiaceae bacterium]|nr:glycosyl hydrolase family 8 [Beijerinckiaceae bacterium]